LRQSPRNSRPAARRSLSLRDAPIARADVQGRAARAVQGAVARDVACWHAISALDVARAWLLLPLLRNPLWQTFKETSDVRT